MEITYVELKKKISGVDSKELSVKTSGILNYMFTTRMVENISKGKCRITDAAYEMIETLTREPKSGDIVAVVNTGIYLLVNTTDEGKTGICARVELGNDFVYHLPKFTITNEPNDPLSSFNKFPIDNMFVIRKSNFDMTEIKQRYEKFKEIWNIIHQIRHANDISEKGS